MRCALPVAMMFLLGCSTHRPHAPAGNRAATAPAATTAPLTRPTLPPMSMPTYSLSKVQEQTLDGVPLFASVTIQTTFRGLRPAIDTAMTELTTASAKNAIQFTGAPIFIYRDATRDPDKQFALQIGFPAAAGAKASGRIKLAPLPPLKTLTINFEGPVSAIDKAYDELVPQVAARKRTSTGESREIYNRWEGGDSKTNQILIGVGVE